MTRHKVHKLESVVLLPSGSTSGNFKDNMENIDHTCPTLEYSEREPTKLRLFNPRIELYIIICSGTFYFNAERFV